MSDLFGNGMETVLEAVQQNVEDMFGDWPEEHGIGTSDIGGCIRRVIRDLGLEQRTMKDWEYDAIRNAVNNTMNEVLNARK